MKLKKKEDRQHIGCGLLPVATNQLLPFISQKNKSTIILTDCHEQKLYFCAHFLFSSFNESYPEAH